MLQGIKECLHYQELNEIDREKIRNERLHKIVDYAKDNSPYYKERYKNLPSNYSLEDLPTVNKIDLMAHFDEWLTDRKIKLEMVQEFMKDLDHIGRKFQGEYLIFTTSGSTGNPLISVCDKTTNTIMTVINILRTFARREDLKAFILGGGKSIGIFATGGFYLGNSSVRARLLTMPWKKRQIAVTSALLPIPKITEALNRFQPTMLGGYPTILELLIEEQLSGRLHIHPVLIMTGGEYLSNELRIRLGDTFKCYVQTAYACTEGGTVACECTEQHFHINDDWLIVEPVDKDNHPVADGVLADKILLTNLFNFTQPFIRYELTDRVTMYHEQCACGNKSPWITLEGRTDDVVTFIQEEKKIRIAPLAIYAILKEIHEIQRFQLVVHAGNKIELRLVPVNQVDIMEAFEKAALVLREFLATHDVKQIEIFLSNEQPQQHPISGKFKHIINLQK